MTPIAKFLDDARVADPLDPAAWSRALERLRESEDALRNLRDQWINAFMSYPAGEPSTVLAHLVERERLVDAEAELAKMRASHSWRLTAPLRWLVASIGRVRSRPSA